VFQFDGSKFFLWNLGKISTGATNRPQELDEAARRRLTKRLYIPLPSSGANHDSAYFYINSCSTR